MPRNVFTRALRSIGQRVGFIPDAVDPFAYWYEHFTAAAEAADAWTPGFVLYHDYEQHALALDARPLSHKAFTNALRDRCAGGPKMIARRYLLGGRHYAKCWPRSLRPAWTIAEPRL